MPYLVQYILKGSLSLSLVYLFYRFVLRRLTFYNWNRFYLFAYTALSFLIPFINVTPVLEKNDMLNQGVVRFIPSINEVHNHVNIIDSSESHSVLWSAWDVILLFISGGMIVLLLRLLIQLLSLRKMIRQSTLVSDEDVRFYQVNKIIIPFSFGNSIFINPSLHNEDELKEIVKHEFIHVRQRHTIDIVWAEIVCILNWYNPFAWFIRKAIRQNLEFIADSKVLESGIDKKQYQYLLLKVTGNNHFSIASQFNFSSLKKRIAMMNKMKSAKLHLVKFLFMLPLVALLLVAFRKQQDKPVTHFTTPALPINSTTIQKALNDADSALWIVDGKEISGKKARKIPPAKIESMRVLKGDEAIKKYKDKGWNGVIEITTRGKIKDNKVSFTADSMPVNTKGYNIDIKNEKGKDIVVIRDKHQRVVKEIFLLDWNDEKEYYEGIYGKGVEEAIEYAVKKSMGLLTEESGEVKKSKMKAEPTSHMRERVNNARVLRVVADTVEWLAKENRFFFKGKVIANDIINDMMVQAESIELDWPGSYISFDGKEFDTGRNFLNNGKSDYWIISLSKDEAMRKYGAKGENGAVEIISKDL